MSENNGANPGNNALEAVKHWLKAQLINLINVQNCSVTAGKTVIVQTWTGVIINVHLVDEPIKTRLIKRILQDSTEIGIGVMFILKASLMPQPDARFEPKEWMLALHALNHDRIYLYNSGSNGQPPPQLSQVHFEPLGTTGDWVAKYGPALEIEKIRYFRTSVKPRYIKGDWQVADFGLNAFWRDRHNPQGFNYRTEYRSPENRQTSWKAWSDTTTWDQPRAEHIPASEIPRPARSRLELCYELLEITHEATRDEVKVAFRKLALAVHPDTSTLPKDEAERKFRELSEAYEFIKDHNHWT